VKIEYIDLAAMDDRGRRSVGGKVTFDTTVPPHGQSFGKSHSSFREVNCPRIVKIIGSFH
jgi:hypothetical protein